MANAEDDAKLSAEQSTALFDFLTHQETYKEIADFKIPGAIHHYGPPFQDSTDQPQAPILQTLLSKFILQLPGLRDVSPQFWKGVDDLIEDLTAAELSESYDKGVLGIRKTLATAISALIEYPARGVLGGFPQQTLEHQGEYDISNPDHVLQAWRDCVHGLVYGDLIDKLFAKAAETDDLKQHDAVVQGMHEFMVVNIASLMHYTLVLSPEGPSLLRMISNVHHLLPYMVMRQTLKVGNVATMISGMVRVMLAKLSVATVTNWIGLSSGADEGMNLLQQIISQVLGWDKRELKKRADAIEKSKDAPPKALREELKAWIDRDRSEHDECRRQSAQQNMSIVTAILASSSVSVKLTEIQHAKAQEYLSLQLAIRDRQQIIRVMCKRNPDILTATIKDGVDAYTPIIRHVHRAVDLSDTLWDFQRFLTDMLNIAQPGGKKGEERGPRVEDFVDLLHRHQSSCHKFLHQVAKNGKEMTSWWQEYAHMAAAHFRNDAKPPASQSVVPDEMATGGLQRKMAEAFGNLSAEDQKAVKSEMDAWKRYIDDLQTASTSRIASVIKRDKATPYGPGAYLARWQQLLDDTQITPGAAKGPVRYGASKSVKEEGRKRAEREGADVVTEQKVDWAADAKLPEPPQADATSRLLWSKFREVLMGKRAPA